MPQSLSEKLKHFLDSIDIEHLLISFNESEQDSVRVTFSIFKNEAFSALGLISDSLDEKYRILEVGAGLCLLSLFLKENGFDVVACEPTASGFGFFEKLRKKILEHHAAIGLEVIEKNAEQLNKFDDGEFDLIFSNNVVEHIEELENAIFAMSEVLSSSGQMIHGCPNYIVPYEPHFGLPVIKVLPNLTKLIWGSRISKDISVWESLNFITYFRVKTIAENQKLDITFKKNTTYHAFMRLNQDSEFKQRHNDNFIGKVFAFLEYSRLLKLLKFLPAWANTPMVFMLTKTYK